MRFPDLLLLALRSLRQNRLHSALMAAAVAIGTAATLFVTTAGSTAQQTVETQLETLGVSGGVIYPTRTAVSAGVTLDAEDAVSVMGHVDGVGAVSPLITAYGSYHIKNWQGSAVLFGTDAEMFHIWNSKLKYGRLLSENDVKNGKRFAVVDSDFAEKHYHRKNIVGKSISLSIDGDYTAFEIVGIVEPQSGVLNMMTGESVPPVVFLPYTCVQALDPSAGIGQLLVEHPEYGEQAANYLSRMHLRENSFVSESISRLRDKLDEAMAISARFLTAIAGISMLVAGVGIMTAMLSAASERRREVGILMSIGASRRDISKEFLAESVLISLLGGLIGVISAQFLFVLIQRYTGYMLAANPVMILTVAGAAVCFGAVFGVLPAVRASQLDPADTLRQAD